MSIENETFLSQIMEDSFFMSNTPGKKQFTKDDKIKIIKYYKNHTYKETNRKWNVSKASLSRWKKQIDMGIDLISKSGKHDNNSGRKINARNASFYSANRNLSNMSRSDIQEYAEFWVTLGKWQQDLKKKK